MSPRRSGAFEALDRVLRGGVQLPGAWAHVVKVAEVGEGDEGLIIDAIDEGEVVGTSGMTFDEWFERLTT
jgi:hypothetical protein